MIDTRRSASPAIAAYSILKQQVAAIDASKYSVAAECDYPWRGRISEY